MTDLNEKVVANVGEVVWFLQPKFTVTEDINDSQIYFNDICQGKVVRVSGATNTNTCIDIEGVNGLKKVGAVQELFFTKFHECLNVFHAVNGKLLGGCGKDWYTEYMELAKEFISYPYELIIPYEKGLTVPFHHYNGIDYNSVVERMMFSLHEKYMHSDKLSLLAEIEELNMVVTLPEESVPNLKEAKIVKVS